jgi:acyl transferase domain-containing protein/NADPH:quinone reductase-like Zn-dependent oxidoreductase/NAD(P)-dependent dehydrogenase (short-subunit alcohol dehydrogenase family)
MSTPSRPSPAGGAAPAGALTPLQRAFIALEQTRAELAALQDAAREPIAIVGIGCRIPGGADDPEAFWQLLQDGRDAIAPLPRDRWDVDALYHPDPEHPGTIATTAGGFLSQTDQFDHAFFGITRREAQGMDPQQRLLLEVCWEALEHAGQDPQALERSSTGVYIGVTGNDYAQLQLETGDRTILDAHFASGIAHSIVSGRLSYRLGLQGPSLTIDTACSSSLVAVHLACQALRTGECRMALAGGVNLILSPDLYIALSHARMLSPDGRCKTFDAAADGFARGEGCGVVVLKRLADARANGDRILAVIRGSAVNQDGASSGLTAPNGPAQEAVIRSALSRAGIAPRLVGYVEAHGTGTQLGDPLELRALGAVFADGRPADAPLPVGSVKTNVGHLESAAGVVGLIKVVLALQHGEIPAHLHCHQPTPHVPWQDLRLAVPTTARAWTPIDGRRIGGVSSFGFSGTNAHVVLEAAPAQEGAAAAVDERRRLFVLSAFDEAALRTMAARHAQALAEHPHWTLAGICRTAALRAHHSHRAAILAASVEELRRGLDAVARGETAPGVHTGIVKGRDPIKVAFLFSGQGSQSPQMGRRLFETEPVFRQAIQRCADILGDTLGPSLLEVLYPADAATGGAALVHETRYTQPALFALEYALLELWRSWGIEPDAVIGHSVGEYAAAYAARILTLEDALKLIAVRGRLMQSLPAGGAMTVVFAPPDDVAPLLGSHAATTSIAAINGRAQTVISGRAADLDVVGTQLVARGIRVERLNVSHAFHSPLVDPILDEFETAAAQVRLSPPNLPLVSNVTGRVADAGTMSRPAYWRAHVRDAVRFADGMRTIAAMRPDVCVELGPHPVLLPMAGEAFEHAAPVLVPSLRRQAPDGEVMDGALAALYIAGAAVDWKAVWSETPVPLVNLPTYAFQRQRCWFSARRPATSRGVGSGHPLLGTRLSTALREVVQFEVTLDAESVAYLRDHRVRGRLILPAAAFVEMALAAARVTGATAFMLEDMTIGEALVVPDDGARRVQTIVRLADGRPASFEVVSSPLAGDDEWQQHASGSYAPLGARADVPAMDVTRLAGHVTAESHLATLAARGLEFGPSLRGVREIHFASGMARGVVTPVADEHMAAYQLPPQLLDACLQVMVAALPASIPADAAYLPFAIERVRAYRAPTGSVTSDVTVAEAAGGAGGMLTATISIADADGLVASINGLVLRRASGTAGTSAIAADLYAVEWEPASDDANWTPAARALASEVGNRLPALADANGLAGYHDGFLTLERLAPSWIIRALGQLGWQPAMGEAVAVDRLARQLGIVPRYHRLLERFLAILEEDGILRQTAHGLTVASWPSPGDPSADADALAVRHQSSSTRLEMTRRCGNELAGILRGTVDPLEQLFPSGSTNAATALYQDNPEAVAFNELVRDAAQSIAAHLPAGRSLRVLEVGGGTGGTTARVAPGLDPARTTYLFTDLGGSLVNLARERFGHHRFMTFATLDLERDPAAQLGHQQFDLILAANVIHATADLGRTLAHLESQLAPGGMILMLETAGRERWIDLTFGLTDGWWRFTDLDVRSAYPLLSRDAWLTLLRRHGFEAEAIGPELKESRQVLLVARKPATVMPRTGRRWLILADGDGIGAVTAERLMQAGHDVTVVDAGADAAGIADALRDHGSDGLDILHLRSLDIPAAERLDGSDLVNTQADVLRSLIAIVQSLGRTALDGAEPPRLWVATRGAQPIGDTPVAVEQAVMWGLGLGIAREHPELQTVRVDLDPMAAPDAHADALLQILARSADDDALAVRNGTVHVARLAPVSSGTVADGPAASVWRLERSVSGVLDELALVSQPRLQPAAGEVEIAVKATGLNFRDVMNAVAMRDDPEPLGGECAGIVTAVGEGVTTVAVGDAVIALATASLATDAIAESGYVAPLPDGHTFAEGTTVPFAFMTARFALRETAALQPGETVLIHAAAGGVGLAALRLARAAGAVVIATAGTEAKRAFLRAEGAHHVFDSRSLRFEQEVLHVTAGRGADVVLNSLAGDVIGASVRCLAADGRFVEIGKRDIWSAAQFAAVRPRGRYVALDLAALRARAPQQMTALFQEVVADLAAGRLAPLPLRAFALEDAGAAFRHMAQARHIGKVVLIPQDVERTALDRVTGDATYLITGGVSGLGLATAAQLVDLGARHLVLVGRRAPGLDALDVIGRWRTAGVAVRVVSADVSVDSAVADIVGDIDRSMPPLKGVIHSAGALDDGALVQQTWDHFRTPLLAKVNGTWALHRATRHHRLDFFVMYSSIVSLFGSSGQANHAAANTFLDVMASYRRALGLPAVSIGWGAWSEIGAAADRRVENQIRAQGIGVIAPGRGRELLAAAMASREPHVAAMPVRWEQFVEHRDARGGRRFLARVVRAADAAAVPVTAGVRAERTEVLSVDDLRRATTAQRHATLLAFVGEQVARVVGAASAQTIAVDQPLNEIGLDSLMAVDLRNRLTRGLALPRSLPATLVFEYPTLEALAGYLERMFAPEVTAPARVDTPRPTDAVGEIGDLSDEEIEALFSQRTAGQRNGGE